MSEESDPYVPGRNRDSTGLLIGLCFLIAAVGSLAWQYKRGLDLDEALLEEPSESRSRVGKMHARLNSSEGRFERDAAQLRETRSWLDERGYPSVVSAISEEYERDQRCEIAHAIAAHLLAMLETESPDIFPIHWIFNGERARTEVVTLFQTPEAQWTVSYAQWERSGQTELIFSKISWDGTNEEKVLDKDLDCTADAGCFIGTAHRLYLADENPFEDAKCFYDDADYDVAGERTRGEHYRPYWQEELDHAYRVAAQAFGL